MANQDQVIMPYSDVTNSGWTPTPLWPKITGETADDTKYANSAALGSLFEVGIQKSDLVTPGNQYPKLYVHRRKRNSTDDSCLLVVTVLKGATVAAKRFMSVASTSFTEYSDYLTDTETKALGDYSDLRLRMQLAQAANCVNCSPDMLAPMRYKVVIDKVQNGVCSTCDGFNGTWILEYQGGCGWKAVTNSKCTPLQNDVIWLIFDDVAPGQQWWLQIGQELTHTYIRYYSPTFTCQSITSDFYPLFATPHCTNWPSKLTVIALPD